MVTKVFNDTSEYFEGYRYLLRYFPSDIHMLSAYELKTFNRTLSMLQFDFHGILNMNPLSSNDDNIERFICYSGKEVSGVAVRAYFEEYKSALDYEEYLIVLADNLDSFSELLKCAKKRNSKYEIVTFRGEERKYLEEVCKSISYIHFWDVYIIGLTSNDTILNTVEYKRFSKEHIGLITQKKTDESNPYRYYIFAESGIEGYSSWTYYENGKPILFASVLPYVNNIAEIKIGMIKDSNISYPLKAICFLKEIIKREPQYEIAILRVKQTNDMLNSILNTGSFEIISHEQHLHLED